MINSVGNITARQHYPYIYFIVKGGFLYIGQTQDIPVKRWGAHMSPEGSFSKNLRNKGDEEVYYENSSIHFWGYACNHLYDNVPPAERKIVTHYVEHKVHIKASCHRHIGVEYKIISDTEKTAVHSCRFTWADQLVEEIIKTFYKDIV